MAQLSLATINQLSAVRLQQNSEDPFGSFPESRQIHGCIVCAQLGDFGFGGGFRTSFNREELIDDTVTGETIDEVGVGAVTSEGGDDSIACTHGGVGACDAVGEESHGQGVVANLYHG